MPEVYLALVFGLVPFYRYLLGMHLLDTGGSLLAVGIQHASWNAATGLGVFSGIWQPRRGSRAADRAARGRPRFWRRERHPVGRGSEEAAAREVVGAAGGRCRSAVRPTGPEPAD